MIVNIVYMFIGLIIGFLIKHEIDVKHRRKRIEKRIKSVASLNMGPYNETLELVKELNCSLANLQNYKNTHKKEVR